MLTASDKMSINAAIEKLIVSSGEDHEAAALVVNFADELPDYFGRKLVDTYNSKSGKGSFMGLTNLGNFQVDNGQQIEESEKSNVEYARIGQFKLWRRGEGRIFIRRFWKADLATRAEDLESPETFVLLFQKDGENFGYLFCELVSKPIFSFNLGFFSAVWSRACAVPLHGKEKGREIQMGKSRKFTRSWPW